MTPMNQTTRLVTRLAHPEIEPGPHRPAPLLAEGGPGDPMVVRDVAAAFELVTADPTLRIDVFESDWTELERDQARAVERGLSDRVSFHHRSAFLCPVVRFLLARSRTRVVVIDRAA